MIVSLKKDIQIRIKKAPGGAFSYKNELTRHHLGMFPVLRPFLDESHHPRCFSKKSMIFSNTYIESRPEFSATLTDYYTACFDCLTTINLYT
jgi:hypothetical protein